MGCTISDQRCFGAADKYGKIDAQEIKMTPYASEGIGGINFYEKVAQEGLEHSQKVYET